MPTSCEMMAAISSVRAASASPMRIRALALSSREVADQAATYAAEVERLAAAGGPGGAAA